MMNNPQILNCAKPLPANTLPENNVSLERNELIRGLANGISNPPSPFFPQPPASQLSHGIDFHKMIAVERDRKSTEHAIFAAKALGMEERVASPAQYLKYSRQNRCHASPDLFFFLQRHHPRNDVLGLLLGYRSGVDQSIVDVEEVKSIEKWRKSASNTSNSSTNIATSRIPHFATDCAIEKSLGTALPFAARNQFRSAGHEEVGECNDITTRAALPSNFEPSATTVIIGKGKIPRLSPGNLLLHKVAKSNLHRYTHAKKREEKTALITDIMWTFQLLNQNGAAFVNFANGLWFEAKDQSIREKIGGTFRDLLHTQYKSSTQSKVAKRRSRKLRSRMEEGKNPPQPAKVDGQSTSLRIQERQTPTDNDTGVLRE